MVMEPTISLEDQHSFFGGIVIPFIWRCGTVAAGLVSIGIGLLYANQDKLLYFPEIVARKNDANPRGHRSPAEHKIPFENHMIPTSDGLNIHSWLLLYPQQDKNNRVPTIVFFHGNAGNIGGRLHNAIQMFRYLQVNVLLVEYRGYGDSDDATPNEAGLKLDGEAALRFATSHRSVDSSKIFIFGRSLGGSVAFHVAQYAEQNNIPLAGVIVENTFLSIGEMVDILMPYIAPLKGIVLRINWDSGAIVGQLRVPVLYLAGDKDELVPHSHMQKLFAKSSSKGASVFARMHVIKNGTHNESWVVGGMLYWERFQAFLKNVRSMRSLSGSNTDDILQDEHFEDGTSDVAVDMGVEVELPNNSGVKSAIPIMPGNLMGMAREAGKKKKL